MQPHPRSSPYRHAIGVMMMLLTLTLPTVTAAPVTPLTAQPLAATPSTPHQLWTRWQRDLYALGDDGESLWIGAAGGVIRWQPTTQRYQRYSPVDGLPQQAVYALAVDPAGNRWFGGDGGLSRFDAHAQWTHWTTANSGLYSNLIDGLAVAGDGAIWVSHGLPNGPISRRAADGTWQLYPNRYAVVTDDYAQVLTTQHKNALWTVAGPEIWVGYWAYDGAHWADRRPAGGQATPRDLLVDRAGVLWALGEQLTSWQEGAWVVHAIDTTGYAKLASDAAGTLWVGGIYTQPDYPWAETVGIGELLRPATFQSIDRLAPLTALVGADNGVWAVGQGWLYQPDGSIADFQDMPRFSDLVEILVDPAERLWLYSQFTSRCSGQFQLLDDAGDAPLANDRWQTDRSLGLLTALAQTPQGDLLATTESSCRFPAAPPPLRYHQGVWLTYTLPARPVGQGFHITDIFAPDERHLYFAYSQGNGGITIAQSGVLVLDDGGTPADPADDRWADYVLAENGLHGAVAVDAQGQLWVGNSQGLYRRAGEQWQKIVDVPPSYTGGVCDLLPTATGLLFVQVGAYPFPNSDQSCTLPSDELYVIQPDGTVELLTIDAAVQQYFTQLRQTPTRNRLWRVGPDEAIWYLSATDSLTYGVKTLHRYTPSALTRYPSPIDGQPIRGLEVDGHNHVWIATNHDLWRLSAPPDFTLALRSSRWLLSPGQSRTELLTVGRQEGFTGVIAVTANSPHSLQTTVTPGQVTVGAPITLTIATTPATAPGVYQVTLLGAGNGISHTLPITVTVALSITARYLPLVQR